ncbi:MAG TPA: DUF3107 domain-containing protein [Actinomycetota bacterium]|nr:DUF3107 domain-containing protein [Actinomycetota bacterium]
MEIVIGVEFSAREIRLEVDQPAEEVRRLVDEAFADERKLLWLNDSKGRQVCVPLSKLTYVEVESEESRKHVGFALPPKDK